MSQRKTMLKNQMKLKKFPHNKQKKKKMEKMSSEKILNN